MNGDLTPTVECHACGRDVPCDTIHEPYFAVLGKPHERKPLCQCCVDDGCALCGEPLLDDTDLTVDNVPERRACHADCVTSARAQAGDE